MCGICQRLCLRCDYPDVLQPAFSKAKSRQGTMTMLFNSPHPLYQATILQSPYVGVNDLELANHFLNTPPKKIATIPGLHALKNLDFPTKTPKHPYLLHGVLAASALQIARTKQAHAEGSPIPYMNRARSHQQLALSSYIRTLNKINAESCHFIFGFSLILAGLELAFCSPSESDNMQNLQPDTFISDITRIFDLMQGAVSVAEAASAWIFQCALEPLLLPVRTMMHEAPNLPDPDIDVTLQELIAEIRRLYSTTRQTELHNNQGDKVATTCVSAVLELRNLFGCLGKEEPDNFKAALGWLAFVAPSYVSLVKVRDPAALTVLAHYGVALHSLNHAWWLRGIGSKLVLSVHCMLDEVSAGAWHSLMKWPLSRISQFNVNPSTAQTTSALAVAEVGTNLLKGGYFETALEYTCSVGFIEG